MYALFFKHPQSVGETYSQHFAVAFGFGVAMILGGLACLVHACVPALFQRTGSQTVARLYQRMVTHRRRVPSMDGFDYAI